MIAAPSINDVREALKLLADIPVPFGNNEGDPLNGDTVLPYLSHEHQSLVRSAEEYCYRYARTFDGQVNRRAVKTMTKNGFPANLGPSQYDFSSLVGSVAIGDWRIDISDLHNIALEDDDLYT